MNKTEFIEYMTSKFECTKSDAEKCLSMFTESVASALSEKKDIALVGFGKFYTTEVPARTGRNPKTGASMQIDAYTQVKFSSGKALKDACNK